MKCCCNCSFSKCLKEHKETLEKELSTIINNWIKEHHEVNRLYIRNENSYIANMVSISSNDEIEVTVKFDD